MSINACMREHGHRFIYDYDTLAKIATHAGFLKMAKRSFMDGADPTLLIDSPERVVESLYFEVAK